MAKQTFTTGQVLTAAQMTSLQQTAMGGGSATAKTASYTLVAADAGTTIIMNSASSTTITVNTALFAAGDSVLIVNQGAGVCTVTAGTATVSTAGSLALGQSETGTLYFLSTSAAIFSDYTQAASASGMTLINRTAFTAQASVTIDNIFTSTYTEYLMVYKAFGSISGQFTMQFVYSGTVESSANYGSAYYGFDYAGNIRSGNNNFTTSMNLGELQTTENDSVIGNITITNVGQSAQKALWTGTALQSACRATVIGGMAFGTARTYTGIKLANNTGNTSGYVEIYGLAKA